MGGGCFFIMKKIKLSFLFIALANFLFSAILDSDLAYVPYYANLEESIEVSGKQIKEGTQFIIIRVEDDQVLANFSRKGIHAIELSKTNIKKLVLEQKKLKQPSSRLAYFIGNKIVSGESDWKNLIHIDEVKKYDEWVILYAASSHPDIKDWLSKFNHVSENTKEHFPNKLHLYIDTEGHQKNLELIGNELDLSIATLPWYLSKGYVKGLGHLILEDELPAIAIIHSTNNIKSIHSGYESVINYLSLDKY